MALITKNVREHAEKCKTCVLQKMRKYLETSMQGGGKTAIDKDTAKQFLKLTNVMEKVGCNVCPYKGDFEKIYGVSPVQYFVNKEISEMNIKY
ncbi:MAG TPA: hypothetical protein PK307_17650 [Spirochaetota bacterium]|jgi:hypothetical protein|nr:hypothetical protein [Spirochaetota bacterium]HOD15359.1 hypothetical protein [Spirochaetota bacterium]HPG51391.1 hypothetical protein [Spirochaetota bacterium]HPN11778.1 hypothetical protein [Spirochaetota bacterium]HQL84027.1 hypothetical protein [Spirochaetota bacterium]